MQLFKSNINIMFNQLFKYGAFISIILVICSICIIIFKGLIPSIDFQGGTTYDVTFNQNINLSELRSLMETQLNQKIEVVEIQNTTQLHSNILMKMKFIEDEGEINKILINQFGKEGFNINQIISIGPKIGDESKTNAQYAIVLSLILIGFYVTFRFDRYYAIGSLAALMHDVLITLGIFSFFNIEISITIIAALLTIVGYSLNDTIVIYDRIRENFIKLYDSDKSMVVNRSLNETLNRTFITSFTTLVVVIILFFYGGDVLIPFSTTLIIGILIGTYSSIFIASPIMLYLETKYPIPETNISEDE